MMLVNSASNGQKDFVQSLVEHGANVNLKFVSFDYLFNFVFNFIVKQNMI